MKTFYKYFFFITLALAFCSPHMLKAINPLYQLSVTNVHLSPSASGTNNTLLFDITIFHTNSLLSGPFEYSQGQYFLKFNPAVANGGTLSYEFSPNSTEFTNPNAVPTNPNISGNQLRLEANGILGAGNGPIISPIFPGTRVVQMILRTSAPSFASVPLNLQWVDSASGSPYTQVYGYIDTTNTNLTGDGSLVIDYLNPPLPVELSGFTAQVNRNNITLNWSTTGETNNSEFEIERSIVNGQWSMVGAVNGHGSISIPQNYSFVDRGLSSGKYKYRLKQIDYSGNSAYHNLNGELKVGTPASYNLSQNYPNPFNPETKIDYDLLYTGKVSIILYDLMGREMAELVNEFKNAGYYSVKFNAGKFSSGVYYYRITAGSGTAYFTSTKKMILMK